MVMAEYLELAELKHDGIAKPEYREIAKHR
jgi:hypothetical protein